VTYKYEICDTHAGGSGLSHWNLAPPDCAGCDAFASQTGDGAAGCGRDGSTGFVGVKWETDLAEGGCKQFSATFDESKLPAGFKLGVGTVNWLTKAGLSVVTSTICGPVCVPGPDIECPDDITVDCACEGGKAVSFDVTVTGGTPPYTVVCKDGSGNVVESGDVFPVGTTTVTCTVTDADGLTDTCTFKITVNQDTTKPTLTGCPGDVTVDCSTKIPDAADVTASDNCDTDVPVVFDEKRTGSGCPGDPLIITRTWTATDDCGNSDSCTQVITVVDESAPEIACPGDVTVECRDDVPGPDITKVTASDNCSEVTVSWEGDTDNGGSGCESDPLVITRTYKAVDACGNSATCTQTITVKDTTAPEVTCPSDVIAYRDCSEAECGAKVAFDPATATDNCGGDVEITYSHPSGSFFPRGETTVTVTAKDSCGNSSTCTFKVTVVERPCTTLTIFKYEDVNVNGAYDGEPFLGGFRFTITYTDPDTAAVVVLQRMSDPATGELIFDWAGNNVGAPTIPEGAKFTVCEVLPGTGSATCKWIQTEPAGGACVEDTATGPSMTFQFGNVCMCVPTQGRTLGFWSNKNGQAILKANDPAWRTLLTACNLRNANGTAFDIAAPPATFATAYGSFRTWLLNATATNMAYMLSAQMAAAKLNVAYIGLNGGALVALPADLQSCIEAGSGQTGPFTINQLIALADASLASYGSTPAGHAQRQYQACLETALDGINNNLYPTDASGGCRVIYP